MTRALAAAGLIGVVLGGVVSGLPGLSSPVALAATGINKQINFQGKVVNSNGTNVADGSYSFVFRLYNHPTNNATGGCTGACVWTETKTLTVTDGIFQTALGSVTSLPGSVDFNSDNIYLGINFNSDGEMSPRIQFTASPYAFNSDALQGLHASDFAQINPASAQSGSINLTGSVQAATSVQAPLVDTATGVALNVGTGTATSVTVGRATSSTNLTLQGSASTSWSATGASGTTTVSFDAPAASTTLKFPASTIPGTYTICTTDPASCSAVYQTAAGGTFLLKNATDTSSISGLAAAAFGYTFNNTTSAATTSGVLKLDNNTNTGSTLLVTANATPTTGAAILKVNQANASATGNLIDLQLNNVSSLAVDTAGNVTQAGGSSTTDTINGQRISAAANFTGTVTAATSVLTPLLDTPSGTTTLNVGTNNATAGISLNQNTTVAAGKNLSLASGTGVFSQTYTGTSDAHTITANSMTSSSALKVNSANNSGTNAAWSAISLNPTNNQGTTAVSTGTIAGLDLQFTQNTSVAGNNETVANLVVKRNDSASTDATVDSILNLANNDTGVGNQIVVTNAINVNGANVTNGLNFTGFTGASKLINSTNFTVSQAGAIVGVGVDSGSGLLQGAAGLTVAGATARLNENSNNNTNINTGTSTGTVTIGGGSAPLVIDSTNFDVSSAGALSGITTISTSSTINGQTISSAASFTGTLTTASTLTVTAGGANIAGNTSINNNAGAATTNIGTGTTTGQITIGGGSTPLAIDSTNFDVTTAGAVTTGSTINGQTISSASIFTGTMAIQGANALTLGTTGTSTGSVAFKGSTASSGTINLVGQNNPTGTQTITLPDATGTVCLQGTAACGFLKKDAQDTSTVSVAATQYTFTNSNTGAGGVLSLVNAGTNSTLSVTQSGNPTGGNALIVANNSNGTPSGNLLDLQAGGVSKFNVTAAGAVVAASTLQTGGIITAGAVGTADTNTLLCRNTSNQIAACTAASISGVAFVQGGNSFTAAGDLGTNDNFGLNIRTNGTTKLTVSTAGDLTYASGAGGFDQSASTGTFKTGSGAVSINGDTTLASGKGITYASGGAGGFDQSASTGTFKTGSGAVSLNGDTTVAANKNLSLASGTGTFSQTYTGSAGNAHSITASSLTTGSALRVVSANNTAANTDWSGTVVAATNSQGTTAVTGLVSGFDVQFTQNTSVAGNNETVANFAIAANGSSSTDATVNSIINVANNDTATGNQITAARGININGANVTDGLYLNGTFGTNLINTSTGNFVVTQAGGVTAAGNLTVQGTGTNTFSGSLQFNAVATDITTGSGEDLTLIANGAGQIVLNDTVQVATLGTAGTATYLCRNSSNQIATCNTTGTGVAFVQGGNSFGAAGDLGTNDAFGLNIRTSGSTKLTVSTAGDLTYASGSGGFDQSASSGTFKTGSGAVTLNGDTTVVSGKTLTANGTVLFQGNAVSTTAFNVKTPAAGTNGNLLTVDTQNSRVGISLGAANLPQSTLDVTGTFRLGGTTTENFTTPVGSGVPTKINIPLYDQSGSGQIVALGVTAASATSARGISLFDRRGWNGTSYVATLHQPTLAVFSPDENSVVGFSWDGSNTMAVVKTMDDTGASDDITLRSGQSSNSSVTTGAVVVQSGDGTGTNTSTGNVVIDSGAKTGSGTAGSITLGGTNATALTLGRSGGTVSLSGDTTVTAGRNLGVNNGTLTVGSAGAGNGAYVNNGSTVNTAYNMSNLASGGWDAGGAAATVDKYTYITANQTTAGQTLTPPNPTASTTYGRVLYVTNIGTASFNMLGTVVSAGSTATLVWANKNGGAGWTLAGADGSGILNQNSFNQTADFRITGTGQANTSFLTPLVDALSGGALALGTSNASAINLNQNSTLAATKTLTVTSGATSLSGATAGSGTALTVNTNATSNVGLIVNATSGQTADILRINDGGGATAVKVLAVGTLQASVKPTTSGGTGAFEVGSTAAQSSNDINGVIGFWGAGVKHAQIAYAVGDGFYLCDSSTGSPSGDFGQCALRVNLYGGGGNFNGGLTATGGAVSLTGNAASSFTTTSGNLSVDSAASLSLGTVNATNIGIGKTGITTTVNGTTQIGASSGTGAFVNNGTTRNVTCDYTGVTGAVTLNTAGKTPDTCTTFRLTTSGSASITVPAPAAGAGSMVYILNNSTSTNSLTLLGSTVTAGASATLVYNGTAWTFAGADGSSILNQNSTAQTANFQISGTGQANTSFTGPLFDALSGGALSVGTSAATGITVGKTGITTKVVGTFQVGNSGSANGAFINNGTTQNVTCDYTGVTGATTLNTAGKTPDTCTTFRLTTSGSATITVPAPAAGAGSMVYVLNNSTSTNSLTLLGSTLTVGSAATLVYNGTAWTFAGADGSSILNQTASDQAASYRISGTGVLGGGLQIGGTSGYCASGCGNLNFASGSAQTMKVLAAAAAANGNSLTVQAGSGGTGTTSGGDLVLQGGAAGSTGTVGGVVIVKSQTNSTTAFMVQNSSGTAILTVDTATSGGVVTIGDATNNATFGSTNELTFNGTARHSKRIRLNAEYVGAVLDADGSNNTGTMTAAYDSTQRMGYYKWTTGQASAQDYDIVITMPVPDDWAAWTGNPTFKVYTSGGTGYNVTAQITKTDGTNDASYNTFTILDGTHNNTTATWLTVSNPNGATYTNNTTAPALAGTGYTAGGIMNIRIHLTAAPPVSSVAQEVRVGDIYLPYLSKW